MEEYTILGNKNVINHLQSYSTIGEVDIFEKAFPSNPLVHVMIHVIDSNTIPSNVIPYIVENHCPTSIHRENTYIVDLENQIIGNFFLRGLVFDSVSNPIAFFNDLRSGKMNIIFLNLDKSPCPDTMGMFLKYIIELCSEVKVSSIHFIFSEQNLYDNLKKIDHDIRPDYFVKYGDQFFSDDDE